MYCLQITSFIVVCWLGPSRMLLSCWPPLRPVTHYWKCCNDMCGTVLYYISSLWAHQTLCAMPRTKRPIKVVKPLSSITLTPVVFLVCLSGVCQSVLWTVWDKSDVSVLPRGWMFSSVSPNKASPCPCCVRAVQREADSGTFPQIQAPLPGLGNASRPLYLLLSGKPMVCGFCLGSACYIQTT